MNNYFKYLLKFLFILQLSKNTNSELCTVHSKQKYIPLLEKFPDQKNELLTMSNYQIPIWYTDRTSDSIDNIVSITKTCGNDISTIIIYGLPNKDCEAKESSPGFDKDTDGYINFITKLHNAINNKNIIYILEPDAISLSLPGKCGLDNRYIENIRLAIDILSQNINAKIYLDIGYWTLIYDDEKIKNIINIVKSIDVNNIIRGFSLNLSNYRTTEESISSCNKLRTISNTDYRCIIDTSRNNNGPGNTWCNLKSAGIGILPTNNTNSNFIDYYMWLKPAIEVDGGCSNIPDSFQGNFIPGDVNIEYFKLLWNQGILKKNKNYIFRCKN